MAVEQAVDQMQVARPAAAGADRELTGHLRLGARGEGGSLLVTHVDPLDGVEPVQRIGEAVQQIADDAVDAVHTRLLQCLGHEIRCRCDHLVTSWFARSG